MSQVTEKTINWKRIFFSVLYLSVSLFIVGTRWNKLFYLLPQAHSYNLERFLWCLASSLCAFGALAWQWRYESESPFPEYITYYPLLLSAISALVFSVCHLSEKTSGFVFYYLSFALCFALSYQADSFWKLLTSVIRAAADRVRSC